MEGRKNGRTKNRKETCIKEGKTKTKENASKNES